MSELLSPPGGKPNMLQRVKNALAMGKAAMKEFTDEFRIAWEETKSPKKQRIRRNKHGPNGVENVGDKPFEAP